MTSYRFCSSTLSDVASSVGKGATARDVLAWLLPLVERARPTIFALSVLPGLEPGILMGEACAGGGVCVCLSAGMVDKCYWDCGWSGVVAGDLTGMATDLRVRA